MGKYSEKYGDYKPFSKKVFQKYFLDRIEEGEAKNEKKTPYIELFFKNEKGEFPHKFWCDKANNNLPYCMGDDEMIITNLMLVAGVETFGEALDKLVGGKIAIYICGKLEVYNKDDGSKGYGNKIAWVGKELPSEEKQEKMIAKWSIIPKAKAKDSTALEINEDDDLPF